VTVEALKGLTQAEATERLRVYGYNELAVRDRRHIFRILVDALREPLLLLLIGTTAIYLLIGDIHEGLLLAILTVVDLGIVVYQDYKTERVLESLRELASPRALVIRDGIQRRIAGREVVPDDIVIVSEGDRVAADALLISAAELKVDESLLTGESVPVRKAVRLDGTMLASGHPGGDDAPYVYSGSMIVHGSGVARVVKTGSNTEMGRIGTAVSEINFEETRLRRATRRLTRDLAIMGGIVSILVIALQGIRVGDWVAALLAGVTTAMSMMPEEIPVVLTVFLTLGAWRISRRHVLTRQVSAIENLGAATVLCTDKTGTLTWNRMTVTKLCAGQEFVDLGSESKLSDAVALLIGTAAAASELLPTDPMERALHDAAATHAQSASGPPDRVYGLSPDLLAVTFVRRRQTEGRYQVAAKGAPEAIASLCALKEDQLKSLLSQTAQMAADGLRVLAVARADHSGPLPETPRGFAFEFLGLVGLSDPVRETVPAAVASCRKAGIRVMMMTGDYPVTARAIARDAGIDVSGEVLTGQQLNELDDDTLAARLRSTNVCARILPQQKLRIVSALKAAGEIVAMTGDGVNDAPALKTANIGIAMGGRGADVAREAASLVLLDDAFESIVIAIRLGRRIFDNLRNALSYIFAVHVPIAGLALAPLLVGWPIVFSPVHIVFLELVIDPVCSIAFEAEPEARDIMRREPRRPSMSLFDRRDILHSAGQGLIGLVAILAVYAMVLDGGASDGQARAIAFSGIVLANLALIFSNRSHRDPLIHTLKRANPILWLVVAAATGMLFVALFITPVSEVFQFAAVDVTQLAPALVPATLVVLVSEATKFIHRRARRIRSRERGPIRTQTRP